MSFFPPAIPGQRWGLVIPSTALPDGSTGYVDWTPSGAATDGKVGTISMWVRLADLSGNQTLVSADGTGGSLSQLLWRTSGNTLEFNHSVAGVRQWRSLSPPLRDVTGWTHICWTWDTTEATQADAITLYINGEEYPLTVTVDLGAYVQNHTLYWNEAQAHNIFRSTNVGNYCDLYGSALSIVDGTAYDPTYFGETDAATGEWVPKVPTGVTWGNNGFYKQDLFDTSAPSQGTAHTFTVNGTITEVSESPTDNRAGTVGCFDTFSPLSTNGTTSALSNGNRTWTTATSNSGKRGTLGMSSGKFNLPFKIDTTGSSGGSPGPRFGLIGNSATAGNYPGASTGPSIALQITDTTVYKYIDGAGATAIGTGGGTTNDVFALEVDFDTDTVSLYKNGSFFATVVSSHLSTDDTWFVEVGYSGSATWPIVTYENSPDAWSYSPSSSAFKANCTANLPPVTGLLSDVFVQVDAGTQEGGVESALAAKRSGWGSDAYVDVFKNITNAENWYYRFSDDSGNEMSVAASSVTDQAATTLSGTDEFLGYSIRFNSSKGTAGGIASHTNGADTTVTHNLGAENAVLVFDAGNNAVWLSHPAIDSGKLVNLAAAAVQATNSNVKNIGSNSFDLDSSLATGDYPYIVLTQTDFIRLASGEGNSAADGASHYFSGRVDLLIQKDIDAATNAHVISAKQNSNNVANKGLYTNLNAVQFTFTMLDRLTTGIKWRTSSAGFNVNTNAYIAFVEPLGARRAAQRRAV